VPEVTSKSKISSCIPIEEEEDAPSWIQIIKIPQIKVLQKKAW
jgi:hypothetical protein